MGLKTLVEIWVKLKTPNFVGSVVRCIEVTMSASSKTRSQDSFHASSQAATGGAYEDTASSVHAGHQSPRQLSDIVIA